MHGVEWRVRVPTLSPQNWVCACHKNVGKSLTYQCPRAGRAEHRLTKPDSIQIAAAWVQTTASWGIPLTLTLSPLTLSLEEDASS